MRKVSKLKIASNQYTVNKTREAIKPLSKFYCRGEFGKRSIIFFFLFLFLFEKSAFAETQKNTFHNPQEILKQIHKNGHVGEGVYHQFCEVCHAPDPVIQLGAPRKGIKSDWASRMKQRDPKAMLKAIDEGMNGMPPRGGCFECSDEDLLAAIRYMEPGVSEAQTK